jgi:RNA polymerase sigma factor (TIGR02999 family)
MPADLDRRESSSEVEPANVEFAEAVSAEAEAARNDLLTSLYPELKRIAERRMRFERGDHTLQPTALISEIFVEFAKQADFSVNDRAHFLAVASQAMRRLLIDHARSKAAEKRGGGWLRLQLDGLDLPGRANDFDAIEIDDLLTKMAVEDPRMAKVVEMHCFGGLTFPEIGETLGVTEKTAKRDWRVAKAWLFGQLYDKPPDA